LVSAEAAWIYLARTAAVGYTANATVTDGRRKERRFFDGYGWVDGWRRLDGRRLEAERRPEEHRA
jgi:hypothetical protein